MEVLHLCLAYVKRYFEEHHLSGFLFMTQLTQVLLFSVNITFGEIKDHSLSTIDFFKNFLIINILF